MSVDLESNSSFAPNQLKDNFKQFGSLRDKKVDVKSKHASDMKNAASEPHVQAGAEIICKPKRHSHGIDVDFLRLYVAEIDSRIEAQQTRNISSSHIF
jgi:hypothetical protein